MLTWSQRWPVIGLTALGALAAWTTSTRTVSGDLRPLAGLMLAVLLAAVALRPRGAVVLLLMLGGTVFPDRFGPFAVAGIRSDIVELLALLVVVAWAAHLITGRAARPRVLRPWLLFEAAVVLGLVVGGARGTDRETLVGSGKALSLYLLAVAIAGLHASSGQQDMLERRLLQLCDLGAVTVVVFTALGLPLGGHAVDSQVYILGQATQAERVRVPLVELLTLALLLVLARVLDRGLRRRDTFRLLLYPMPILLSFNRSTWVPLVIAVALLAWLRRGERRAGRATAVTLATVILGGLLVVVAGSGALGRTSQAIVARASSALNPHITRDFSYTERQDEVRRALHVLEGSPLVGVGVGRPYGARVATYRPDPPRIVYSDRLYSHNTYLGVWLQLGLLGLVAVATIGAAAARETILAVRRLPPPETSRHLAAGLALLALAGAALLQTSLGDRPTILALSCALALLQRPQQEREPAA